MYIIYKLQPLFQFIKEIWTSKSSRYNPDALIKAFFITLNTFFSLFTFILYKTCFKKKGNLSLFVDEKPEILLKESVVNLSELESWNIPIVEESRQLGLILNWNKIQIKIEGQNYLPHTKPIDFLINLFYEHPWLIGLIILTAFHLFWFIIYIWIESIEIIELKKKKSQIQKTARNFLGIARKFFRF